MNPTHSRKTIAVLSRFSIGLVAIAGLAVAQSQVPQDQTPQNQTQPDQTPHQWRTFNQNAPAPEDAQQVAPAPGDQSAPPAPQVLADQQGAPVDPAQAPAQVSPAQPQVPLQGPQGQPGNYPPPPPNASYGNYGNYGYGQQPPAQPVPAHLTIQPGTYVTVRINQYLSSDKNQTGDAFAATLAQPLVVNGVVVAQRGQTVGGSVSEAQKAGRVEGTSRLGLQLTDLTLADGTNVPIQSQMINRNGPTSVGRDAAAIGGTTALGAAIGAGVGWGQGAAIGAGAGAAVGILGVLLTRGRPTIVYPESTLTFRIDSPVDIATDHAPQAFRYASQQDYGTGYGAPGPRPAYGASPYGAPYGAGYGPAPVAVAPYPYPYYGYGYPYYPYYPGFGVYIGPGFYGRGFYGGFRR